MGNLKMCDRVSVAGWGRVYFDCWYSLKIVVAGWGRVYFDCWYSLKIVGETRPYYSITNYQLPITNSSGKSRSPKKNLVLQRSASYTPTGKTAIAQKSRNQSL
ncbi:MAG: hypothetical protein JGK17_17385 [Microcoleus sp. PH2017_10_PVI_O_A]|uniref:hypothetical protein n=1 Tax=unclassified Microcoleus TaxID=2642155 RepID=UPI001D895BE6|nr:MULTISPECIES: hypothetical protein [unclassified Microcoleus]MCC3407326.1 hypothetical protein [Microcoleus sp. PH2017_10_PVI_O_A]MCC3461382.1 hypothetical protein [Microcoleus sp. PH2017_11_PCY_U_A]MCC3479857.1 hypothetical protein [Microcoleus sp. PH2017_12_PCY_D_A]MCC3528551.1 hypothetical protein [Microcoleus sp. PH2017_21_RUC_O_A]MCC3540727.1 hypothetical protein [Microcoleus sp. PH2017_22_RUC_O_B]